MTQNTVSLFIIPIFLTLGLTSIAQVEIDNILRLQSRPTDRNSYCVQTIHNKLNNSSIHFQGFLQNELRLSQTGDEIFDLENDQGVIQTTYIPGVLINYGNEDLHKVHVRYDVFILEDEIFVDKMHVWGNWETVAKIFIMYYPTTLNIEYLKNNKAEVTSYYGSDRSVFSSEIKNGVLQGRITVKINSSKSRKEFISDYQAKKSEYLKKEALKKEQENIERQKRLKAEAERKEKEKNELSRFLKERNETVYSIAEIDPLESTRAKENFRETLLKIEDYSIPLETKLSIHVRFDTLGKDDITLHPRSVIPRDVTTKIEETNINAPQLKSYYVQTEDLYNYEINFSENSLKVKKKENLETLDNYDELSGEVEEHLKGKPLGTYILNVKRLAIDEQIKVEIETVKYRKPVNWWRYVGAGALIISGIGYYITQ